LRDEIDTDLYNLNSLSEIINRNGTKLIIEDVNITGNNNSYNINVFKFTGAIQILCQYAIITEVTDLSNMTGVYADIWDGSTSVNLTDDSPGATLSGFSVGSMFTKDQAANQAYTVMNADQCRLSEPGFNQVGRPFIINAKNGVDNYIRFNYTTNTTLDFKMSVYFTYRTIDGGTIEVA